jgi:uncharacterized protein YjbI with pentapeptide repeats
MKPTTKHDIQSPRLPRNLKTETIATLADHAEYFAASISGCELVKQAAAAVTFEQVLLRRITFVQSRLPELRLLDVQLDACDLSGVDGERARLLRVAFTDCRLLGVQLLEARCEDLVFQDCTLESAIFAGGTFKAARFENCVLREAVFTAAHLSGVAFRRCDLARTDLRGCRLGGADFRGSIIDGMQVDAPALKGAIIEPAQATQVVNLLGVIVKEQE